MSDIPFKLGLAIWGYQGWLGDLFPLGSQSRDFLTLYSRRFHCVEGNTTFYATPDVATLRRWAAQTPSTFRLCPKLPKSVTHRGELRPQLPAALKFLERMQHLEERLGPLFMQLPPRYGPRQFDDLHQFLEGWVMAAPDCAIALEVRHIGWFEHDAAVQLTALLEDLGVGRVLLDSRPIYEGPATPQLEQLPQAQREKKPRVPLQTSITSDFAFVRYVSHPVRLQNQVYLSQWVHQVAAWLQQGKSVYFFVHCPIEKQSPTIARWFQSKLEAVAAVLPLPWNQLSETTVESSDDAAQLRLFDL